MIWSGNRSRRRSVWHCAGCSFFMHFLCSYIGYTVLQVVSEKHYARMIFVSGLHLDKDNAFRTFRAIIKNSCKPEKIPYNRMYVRHSVYIRV